jgi:hypothetical protein
MEKRHNPEISRFYYLSISGKFVVALLFKQFLLLLCKGFFQQTATTRIRYNKG